VNDAGERDEPEEYDEDEGEAPLPWRTIAIGAAIVAVVAGGYFGVRSFRVERELNSAERLIAARKYDEALAALDGTSGAAAGSGRALLLRMKAEFLRGNWQAAGALAQRNSGKMVKGDLAKEVNALAQRAQSAVRNAGRARELFARGDVEKAELLLSEAAGLYPESGDIRDSLDSVQGTLAFQKKDYARFLQIAEGAVQRRPESPSTLALLASALSAQYAATGDSTYKEQAENALQKAGSVSTRDPMAKALHEEYAPRIRHRLETREIIDRTEYDRRFRAAKPEKKK
jgi:tetratricopeptide (TPR) repeat protein